MTNARLYQLDHCTYRCGFHLVWIPKYRGYYVSTVGLDEVMIKRYVENQQHHQIEMPKLPL